MAEHGTNWGKVLMGAAVVTAAAAACIFIGPSLGGAIGSVSQCIGTAIGGLGSTVSGIGAWIGNAVAEVAKYGATHQAATLVTAAGVGAIGVLATSSFVDRLNRSTEMVTGRG